MPTKSARAKSSRTKRIKLALIVFLVIFGLLLAAQIVKFTKALYSPWGGGNINRSFSWEGDFNINLVIRVKGISLLIFKPQERKLTIVNLPDSTYFEAGRGFGKWMLSSIYGLGQSQEDLGGGQLLKDSVKNLFGLPIDGFLDFSGKYSQKNGAEMIQAIRESPFGGFILLSDLKTDLNPLELFRLKMGLSSVRFDKIQEINLEKLGVLGQERLADGTLVSTLDPVQLDLIFTDFADSIIKTEHKTIAVFNATNRPQLAQKWARLISNLGGDVIITSNSQNKLKVTQVMGAESKTLERLKQILESTCSTGRDRGICGKINPKLQDFSSRAEINIFLGEDLSNL